MLQGEKIKLSLPISMKGIKQRILLLVRYRKIFPLPCRFLWFLILILRPLSRTQSCVLEQAGRTRMYSRGRGVTMQRILRKVWLHSKSGAL